MPDDLYSSYMRVSSAWTTHRGGCTACQLNQPCSEGKGLYKQFADLQDDYQEHLNRKGES